MQRIDTPTAAGSLPAPATTTAPGYFTGGNPGTGVAATVLTPDWCNSVQEELMSILAAASVTPAKGTNNQVLAALQAMFGGVVGSMRKAAMAISAASATATFTADEIIVETALGGTRFCLASYSQTINLATTGAGGMDTGTAPASGYVALYAIFNPTTGAAGILATNATASAAPNVYAGGHMPSGYTASALISVWPTNPSGLLVAGFQRDRHISMSSFGPISLTTNQSNAQVTLPVPLNAVSVDLGMTQTTTTGATGYNLAVASGSTTISGLVGANPVIQASGLFQFTNINTVYFLTAQTLTISWSVNGGSSQSLVLTVDGYSI